MHSNLAQTLPGFCLLSTVEQEGKYHETEPLRGSFMPEPSPFQT
jgi:hypothetical protein